MMNLSSTTATSTSGLVQPPALDASARRDPAAFATALTGEKSKYQEARTAAEQLVATTFVVPMLKQFRESNKAAPPFAPTSAEKMLRGLTDTSMAESIVHRANWPLVERLAQGMLNKGKQSVAAPAAGLNESTP